MPFNLYNLMTCIALRAAFSLCGHCVYASGNFTGAKYRPAIQGLRIMGHRPTTSRPQSANRSVNAPRLDKKTLTPVAAVALFIAVVVATHFLHGRVYYPHVVVESQENFRLEFLQHGVVKNE